MEKIVRIKLTTPWNHDYYVQLPKQTKIGFEINNNCQKSDYWIIWGGLPNVETVSCHPDNIFYITDEAHKLRTYNQDFLNQFTKIFAVRTDLRHKNKIEQIHEPQIWYFNKSRAELDSLECFEKTKMLSVVSSDLTLLAGHKKRYAFVNKMIGHFKDKLDVYGRGFNEIQDKWTAIAPYKYSLAIENNVIPDYFTEKLTECFLSYTMPIYFGCPNIDQYFDTRSMILIDINDYKNSIKKIEQAIDDNLYEKALPYIIEARNQTLNQYHIFSLIQRIIEKHPIQDTLNENITIYPEQYFNDIANQEQQITEMSSKGIKLPLKILYRAIKNKFS